MSNEKPVRITVGDVKEVTEATAVQSESAKETFAAASQTSISNSTPTVDTTSNGLVFIGGIIGLILIILAGYLALGKSGVAAAASNAANNTPVIAAPPSNTVSTNPAGTNTPAPAANNSPADSNTPADANTPAGNNTP